MDNSFRIATLEKIAKAAGILSSFVEKALDQKALQFKNMGTVGTGTTVMAPSGVVKPDGSVDIVINIRGIAGSDTRTAAQLGTNAVIITAEAGGMGSKENVQTFGNAAFINKAIDDVLARLQAQYPDKNIHRGKLVLAGFSGGGGAIANILTQRNQVKGDIDAVVINDGLHTKPGSPGMQAVIDYAKEAETGDKKLRIMHTAIKPWSKQLGFYTSTTESADYILNQLGLQSRKGAADSRDYGINPYSQASKGGVEITALYGPDRAKDPYYTDNRPGSLGDQHVQSLKKGHPYLFRGITS